jgi:hypothetical protein
VFAVAGFAGYALRFAFLGNLLTELIDNAFQRIIATQWVFVGFRHIASIDSDDSRIPSTRCNAQFSIKPLRVPRRESVAFAELVRTWSF